MPSPEQKPKPPQSRTKRIFRRLGIAAAILILSLFSTHQYVLWSGNAHIYTLATSPAITCILVPGASVLRDGSPSQMLEDRLRVTALLAKQNPQAKVLISGDREPGYDEVGVMSKYLRQNGIAADRLMIDPRGYRTFDSLYRARHVYGFVQLTVVSNPFHVPRAVFLGRQLGIEANGIGAPHGYRYSRKTLWQNKSREIAARILAFADIFLLGTQPRPED